MCFDFLGLLKTRSHLAWLQTAADKLKQKNEAQNFQQCHDDYDKSCTIQFKHSCINVHGGD